MMACELNDGSVRDDLRGYVLEQLGDPGGVLIVDETGFATTSEDRPITTKCCWSTKSFYDRLRPPVNMYREA